MYVLSSQVRNAATLQQSFQNEAWVDSLHIGRAPPSNSPRGGPPHRPSPRERAMRPAPQMPSGAPAAAASAAARAAPQLPSRPRTAAEAFAFAESSLGVSEYKTMGLRFVTPQRADSDPFSPSTAEQAPEPIKAARPAPALPAGPVISDAEIRHAQKCIVDKYTSRFASLQRAFRTIDTDASGAITTDEMWHSLEVNNVAEMLRRSVVEKLFSLIDADGSGKFDYQEFVRILTAEDVLNMGEPTKKANAQGWRGFGQRKEETVRVEGPNRRLVAGRAERDDKKFAEERVAGSVGMSVEEYKQYFGVSEIKT